MITPLKPFFYQTRLKDFLQKKTKLWNWFSNDENKEKYFEDWKKNLLKDSYRMDDKSHPELYAMVADILEQTGMPIKVIIYQEQMSYQNNVSISFYKDEAHIMISGRVLKLLSDVEMKAILAHELYHYYLFSIEDKAFEIADRLITSISNDTRSNDMYIETARLFKLYMELYCDRGAYMIMQSVDPVISSLVKLTTGIDKVNPESYISQADEILNADKKSTDAHSHPEVYIRAKALELWSKDESTADEEILKYIEPSIEYDRLNIFSQTEINDLTADVLRLILKPSWNKSDPTINLAKQYIPSLNLADDVDAEVLFELMEEVGDSTKKYMSYVLLDFALVDPDQENAPMGYAFELAENMGMKVAYKAAVKKEMKLTERAFKEMQEAAAKALNEMNESKEDSLYGA